MTDTHNITEAELVQIIEQMEQLDSEKKDVGERQKEILSEAKARGFDTKIIRKIVRMRKLPAAVLAEEQALIDVYKAVLGME